MSLERACANCGFCFYMGDTAIKDEIEFHKLKRDDSDAPVKDSQDYITKKNISLEELDDLIHDPDFKKECVLKSNYVFPWRNEAMKALEEVPMFFIFSKMKALRALKACRECDYSKPQIIEILKDKNY